MSAKSARLPTSSVHCPPVHWCLGMMHGPRCAQQGQRTTLKGQSLTSVVWARFFLSAGCARLPEPRGCRDSSISLPISPWECSDCRCYRCWAISSASFPLQALWIAFHCMDIWNISSLNRHSSWSYTQVTGDDAAFHFDRAALIRHMACRQSLPSCRTPTMLLSVCLSPMICRGLRLASSHLSRFACLMFQVLSQETTTSDKAMNAFSFHFLRVFQFQVFF